MHVQTWNFATDGTLLGREYCEFNNMNELAKVCQSLKWVDLKKILQTLVHLCHKDSSFVPLNSIVHW